jgi:hypothetical protein
MASMVTSARSALGFPLHLVEMLRFGFDRHLP